MLLEKKLNLIIVSLIILLTNLSVNADVTDDAKATKISGGEDHTLVLTKSKNVFGCVSTRFGEDCGFEESTQAEQLVEKQVEAEVNEDAINDLLECIEDMWLNGDLKDKMTEEGYTEFREHLESLLK